MELIMKIPQAQTVRSLDYLEMIPMITWQSVGQNGYIKTEWISLLFLSIQDQGCSSSVITWYVIMRRGSIFMVDAL